jgi:hypothetical protein
MVQSDCVIHVHDLVHDLLDLELDVIWILTATEVLKVYELFIGILYTLKLTDWHQVNFKSYMKPRFLISNNVIKDVHLVKGIEMDKILKSDQPWNTSRNYKSEKWMG